MQGKKDYQEKLFTSFQLSDRVPKDNFYYRLKEALDLDFLYSLTEGFYGKSGQKSIDPVVFFKLCLVGYLENVVSDRKLVSSCSMRMDILYFLNYDIEEEIPWHSTISRTRQLFPEAVFEEVFNKVLSLCIDNGMVTGHTQSIDSAPVKANASMGSLEIKIPQETPEDHLEGVRELNPAKVVVKKDEESEEITLPVSSRKKKKTKKGANNKTHYSPHDPDARISVKPGKAAKLNYHCSLSVDSEAHVITDIKAYHADRKDSLCLQDIITRTKFRLWGSGLLWQNVLADTNYSSGRNYAFIENQGLLSYIPPHSTYKGGPKNFTYIKEGNYWLCPQGKRATFKSRKLDGKSLLDTYLTSRSDCRDCPIKAACIGKAHHKRVKITAYREEFERNITRVKSRRGQYMASKRQSTVEPVFGTLKEHLGLGKMNTIGIEQANKGMHVAAIAYNLKKYLKFTKPKVKSGANAVQQGGNLYFPSKKAILASILAFLRALITTIEFLSSKRSESRNLSYHI